MFIVINKFGKGAVVQMTTVFGPIYHVACGRVLWNRIFETFIKPPFWESIILEIHRLWWSSFFWKRSKFNADFKNAEENREKVICFKDKSIWIGCVNLSLLRRKYLSSAVNVLTNSLKILHSTKIDFFERNNVDSNQWIWQRCRRPDCNSVWAGFPCCMWKGALKRDFSDI